ncbi:hypothetical protein [Amycolatopsis echigonensis]|uniref:Phosphate transporter family protein n=1 Tax=Amycolatopsis echigonensis TaxID=2576905 RepID=A0A8E2B830_9PSEU|nr:hypothetical protein [Amycolatopsis echigonensis]MBB2504015.1 hypothetical protein [Amycolatopsis echigonensis]
MAVLIGVAGWVAVATVSRLPVSTTHAIVGVLLGAGVLLDAASVRLGAAGVLGWWCRCWRLLSRRSSTTHVSTGAIAGASGTQLRLNERTLRDFAIAWTLTPVVAGVVAAGVFAAIR